MTPEVFPMSDHEISEWRDAERLGYENMPCTCRECREAGVAEKPIRFVPYDDPEVKGQLSQSRVVLLGHWIHGEPLARWYVAKDKFWREARALFEAKAMPPVIAPREPGEEG